MSMYTCMPVCTHIYTNKMRVNPMEANSRAEGQRKGKSKTPVPSTPTQDSDELP